MKEITKYLIRVSTLGKFPLDTAICNGVHPFSSVLFTLLPAFNKSSIHERSPYAAAWCNGEPMH
jgi:hypothetical protein